MRRRLSVVVVAYDMARELPRTLRSLQDDYQVGMSGAEYEVIVVDNGSPEPVPTDLFGLGDDHWRLERLDPAPPSPARAANTGIEVATGDIIGLIVDGARMASPGLLAAARDAATDRPRAVVATLGWHLGPHRHMEARAHGYDEAAEDALLAEIAWPADGDRLFTISTPAASSSRGWFGPLGESSALFMHRSLWTELEGLDEAFALPGGGLVNHDLYRRACERDDVELLIPLGQGTFHQIHGGAATDNRLSWDEMCADYRRIRGVDHAPPTRSAVHVGRPSPGSLRGYRRDQRKHRSRGTGVAARLRRRLTRPA